MEFTVQPNHTHTHSSHRSACRSDLFILSVTLMSQSKGPRRRDEDKSCGLYRRQSTKTEWTAWPQFTVCSVCRADKGEQRALPRYHNVRDLGFIDAWLGNNTTLETTVYIADRKAFSVCLLFSGIVIRNHCVCGCLDVCECWSSPTETVKDVTLLDAQCQTSPGCCMKCRRSIKSRDSQWQVS